MKKPLGVIVSVVALALMMFAPSKASAQVSIYIGPGYPAYGNGYGGYYPRYGYGYGGYYPRYGYGYGGYPSYGYGGYYNNYAYPRRYARRYVRRHARRWY